MNCNWNWNWNWPLGLQTELVFDLKLGLGHATLHCIPFPRLPSRRATCGTRSLPMARKSNTSCEKLFLMCCFYCCCCCFLMCTAGRKCCKQLLLHSAGGGDRERGKTRERETEWEVCGSALLLLYGVKLFICKRIKEAAMKSNNKINMLGVWCKERCSGGGGASGRQRKESSTNFWP